MKDLVRANVLIARAYESFQDLVRAYPEYVGDCQQL